MPPPTDLLQDTEFQALAAFVRDQDVPLPQLQAQINAVEQRAGEAAA